MAKVRQPNLIDKKGFERLFFLESGPSFCLKSDFSLACIGIGEEISVSQNNSTKNGLKISFIH